MVFGNIYSSNFTILGFYIKLEKSLGLLLVLVWGFFKVYATRDECLGMLGCVIAP